MTRFNRYCKNTLQQYGNKIKAFEERLDNPLEDKVIREVCEKHEVPYQRRIMVCAFLRRGGNISCYDDIVEIANG